MAVVIIKREDEYKIKREGLSSGINKVRDKYCYEYLLLLKKNGEDKSIIFQECLQLFNDNRLSSKYRRLIEEFKNNL